MAPVLEEGATARDVELPADVQWYDWFTLQPVESGTFSAEVDEISVFAAAGTTVPTFDVIPDTLVSGVNEDLISWADADGSRTLYLFGGGGTFTEADGTEYRSIGQASEADVVTATLSSGCVSVGGVEVEVSGEVERTYTFIVVE